MGAPQELARQRFAIMPIDSTRSLALPHGLAFADLYSIEGAARIDELFATQLAAADAALAEALARSRARKNPIS